MITTSTIAVYTRLTPRWLAIGGYVIAPFFGLEAAISMGAYSYFRCGSCSSAHLSYGTGRPSHFQSGERLAMPLQFHCAVEEMEIWSATSDGYSFVISFESAAGPGFHGRPGYVASWRPLYHGCGAVKIIGSPFKSFDAAEAACDAMLKYLMNEN